MLKHVYIETSALNYFLDNFSWDSLLLIKKTFYEEMNTVFCISTSTLSELMLTANEERREQLIYTAQIFCYDKLINSPSEFIINYIKAGMPKQENRYNFYSALPIATVWTDICNNPNKTLTFDKKELAERQHLMSKSFNVFIENTFINGSLFGTCIKNILDMTENDLNTKKK